MVFTIFSCKNNLFYPDEPIYYLFEEHELKLLWENTDSALILQDNLKNGKIGRYDINASYGRTEVVKFVNRAGDTIDYTNNYGLFPGYNQWFINNIPMIAEASLYSLDESYLFEIQIVSEKNIGDELNNKIRLTFNWGGGFSSNFALEESVNIGYSYLNKEDESLVVYLNTFKSDFMLDDIDMGECLFFLLHDQNQIEKLKIVYSTTLGFLKILIGDDYELNRCF